MIDYRNRAIELVEDCVIEDFQLLAVMCLKYMSQDDVRDMLEANEIPLSYEEFYRNTYGETEESE